MTMEFPQLLEHIKASTITITLLDDQLKIDAPKGSLTKPIITSLKNYKQELIDLLKEDGIALSGYASSKNDIKPAENKDYYPLSSPQKRLFFLNQFDKTSTEYNMPQIIRIEGQLNINKLEESFQKLIERHESFRTTFHVINQEPIQKITETCVFQIETLKAAEEDLPTLVKAFVKPFNLEEAPLLNIQLIETGEAQFVLMIDKHHIISDGVSEVQITNEIIQCYNNLELPHLKIQYKDYVEWTLSETQQAKTKESEAFWLNQFENTLQPLELPLDFKRPAHKSFNGDAIDFLLTSEQTNALKLIAKTEQVTLFMLVLSIYNILLSKLSNQEDIVIGTPIAGRTHADLEGVIGMFVNTLPLRSYPKAALTFKQFLKTVKETIIKSFEYQNQPLEELIEALQLERNTSRSPLFDVLFAFQNIESAEVEINGLKFKPYDNDITVAKYEQNLSCYEENGELHFNFEYVTDLYKRETIERFIGYFKSIINQVIENISIEIGDIEVLSEVEKDKLLYEFNNTAINYSKDKTIVDLFKVQAEKHGTTKAVILNENSITYNELDNLSNNLAQTLIERGVTTENAVGVYLDRSIEMIVAILGILKSGGAYLPLDITQPKARVEKILEDSNCKYIVTDSKGEGLSLNCTEINIETISSKVINVTIQHKVQPTDLAYLLYTSGSTGTPKGVMVEHHSVVNLIEDRIRVYGITSAETVLLFAPIYFDASVEQILVALLSGSSLVVIKKETLLDTNAFNNYLRTHKVTHLNVVPSFLREMDFSANLTLKRIVTGGEAIDLKTAKKCVTTVPLFNAYGPTECTVTATNKKYTNIDTLHSINIGQPLSNTTCYVLDKSGKMSPIGVQGELYIGGAGVSRGYVNNKVLTNNSFITSSFKEGERLYKTGDLAKWNTYGDLEYLGRVDHQVKIRGHRIELGEIEQPLLDHPEITQSVVLVKGKENNACLIGYYTTKTGIEEEALKNYLRERLPMYMVPSHLVKLSEFPLMNNGKLNRKLLPEPDYKNTKVYKAPVTVKEKQLTNIWSALLNIDSDKISINTSFFDIGGHSLKAISLVNRIREVFNVELSLKQIFSESTIETIANSIEKTSKKEFSAIPKAEKQERYPLSSAQRRMYVLYEFNKDSVAYNMPQAYRIRGEVNAEHLEDTFKALIQRHESLRTIFKLEKEDVVQRIIGHQNFNIKHIVINDGDEKKVLLNQVQPFNLNSDYPIRIVLLKVKNGDNILFIDTHHIISDGASQNIILKEFWELYNNNTLAPLQLQYKDYAVWQRSEAQQELLSTQKTYWLTLFEELPEAINLPADYERPLVTTNEGSVLSFEIDKDITSQLRALSKTEEVTLFMLLLGISNVLLSKLSNQEDIVLGTITSGRNHSDVEDMMGMFVNTLVLKNEVKGDQDFKSFIKVLKENTLQAFENQLYQYDELVEVLDLKRDTSRNPLFDVMYSYQRNTTDSIENEIINSDLKIDADGIDLETNNSKFDLTIAILENETDLQVAFEYSTALFKAATIERFKAYFNTIIETLLKGSTKLLKDINILSKEEQLLQIETFNANTIAYDKTAALYDLFEKQVALNRNRNAVIFNDESITYGKLETRANSLAYKLMAEGVTENNAVGIYLDRSVEMIVAILGILKSGGAYLPLDVEQPDERIHKIIGDSSCKFIITNIEKDTFLKCKNINIKGDFINEKVPGILSKAKGNNLAYYIYTSGSTGTPKGVMIEHHSVVNFIEDRIRAYTITNDENILLFAPIYFDASVEQLFIALLSGAAAVIIEKETALDTNTFNTYLLKHKVTHIHAVPSFLREMEFSKDLKLKRILSGGEAIDVKTINKCLIFADLHNRYGPTEATVASTSKVYKKGEITKTVTIGKPLSNTTCYVLDKNNNPCPIGIEGELHIGGAGVSRGYVNNETLTRERFIKSPFKEGERLYKTGDLVKWLSNGELEFFGRVDHQVKIRGHRIELGEIEQALLKHSNIVQSVVLLKGKGNNEALVGYYTINGKVEISDIENHLDSVLPKYMVPSYLVELSVFPLMSNGKLNRKRLPEPEYKTNTNYAAPSNETEKQLVKIWSELLNIQSEAISVTTSFFDLGGHSLKAIRLINNILKTLNFKISMVTIFQKPTIKDIAAFINKPKEDNIIEDEITVLLKKGNTEKNLFLIHDGSGDVLGYLELSKHIKTFNCWGLKSPSLQNSFPTYKSLETIAANYIEKIKKIQPEGPYHILGWSFGGNISYEIVKQLEQQNEKVASYTVIDSKIPFVDEIIYENDLNFTLEKEKELIKTLLKIEPSFLEEEHTVQSLWETLTAHLIETTEIEVLKASIPEAMKLLIPNFDFIETKTLIQSINTIRTLEKAVSNYKLNTRLNTPLRYFKASESTIETNTIKKHFNQNIQFVEVEGNHFSILKNKTALQQIANTLEAVSQDKVLEKI